MRQKTQIIFVAIAFLVPSLALAIGTNGGNGDKENGWMQRQRKSKIAATQQAKVAKATLDKAYGELGTDTKENFDKIVAAADADKANLDKSQLIGFVNFLKANPDARCAPKTMTAEDLNTQYHLVKPQPVQQQSTVGSGGNQNGLGGFAVHRRKPAIQSGVGKVGLMCLSSTNVSQPKQVVFMKLPAATLNKVVGNHIVLDGETNVAETTTPSTSNSQQQAATGYASTSFNSYLTQSMSDAAGKTPENTAFTDQANTERQPASTESGMHFSTSAAAQ